MTASHAFTFVDPRGRKEKGIRRRNPDGSVGGWVARSAKVHPSAVVHVDAIVEPGAVVTENAIVRNGTIVVSPSKG